MGGEYYEREVFPAQSSEEQSKTSLPIFSVQSSKVFTQNSLDKSCDPRRFGNENRKLVCKHKNPIVFAFDVFERMGDCAKVLLIKNDCILFIFRLFTTNCQCFSDKL